MKIKNTNQNQPQEKTEPKSCQKGLGNKIFKNGVQNNPLPPLKSGTERLKSLYNIEQGKIDCRCLIRKWKFCNEMKSLAGGGGI